jgi:Response regulator containing a CheY-like receiver domain and an HD-GYP domain
MSTKTGYLLVVEDIPDILNLLEATLKFKGYRVVTARNGEEALEIIHNDLPDLVIADILMPKMDGFSMVHRLRINPETRRIPVVFLSATYVAPEDKAFALSLGATRFIEKPVDLPTFLPVIEKLLQQGVHTPVEPLNEYAFYEGYRKRLEIKLSQKNIQIARDERLLDSLSEDEKIAMKKSMEQAVNERQEIQTLLAQIRDRLDTTPRPKES